MPIRSEPFQAIATFVRVAEARGFTAAARRMGLSTAAVSKSISRLENQLGVKLLNRTTRSVSLTDDGDVFFRRCRDILSDLEGAQAAVSRAAEAPRGKLRVHCPMGLGRRILMPAIGRLTRQYPALSVDVDLSDRNPDLAEEGIDAALRVGQPADARLIARALARSTFVTCASPDYLARHGTPASPEALADHACLAYVVPQTGRYHDWAFARDGQPSVHAASGLINVNNAEALLEAAIDGAGIARVASFIAAAAVLDGRLRLVLSDCVAPSTAVHLVYLPNRHLSPRVRAFADVMTEALGQVAKWEAAMGLPPFQACLAGMP